MYEEPTTLEFAGSSGLRLVGDVRGPVGGPPVLLFAGGGQTRHSWTGTAIALAQKGWRSYTIDQRGHGDSGWPEDGHYLIDDFAADVRAVAGSLDRRPVLVGASLGGVASLVATAEADHPVAAALVLVDIAPRVEQDGVGRIRAFMSANSETGFASLEEVADAVAAYNPHRPRPKDLSGLRRNVRLRDDGRWYWHWDPRFQTGMMGSPDETRISSINPDRLEVAARSLDLPVLLVRGRDSDLLSEEGARLFLEMVPHAEFVDVAGAGHMVAGDRNDHFNVAMFGFLERVHPAGETGPVAAP